MNRIDQKLESLMGADEYTSLMAAPSYPTLESVSLLHKLYWRSVTSVRVITNVYFCTNVIGIQEF